MNIHTPPRHSRGFTLIELMIVVVIAGVLLSLAYVGYQSQMRKSRRATAQACLMQQAQYLERYYAAHLSYKDDNDLPVLPACPDTQPYYQDTVLTGTASTYNLSATAKGSQAGDSACTPLTLDHMGERLPQGCW